MAKLTVSVRQRKNKTTNKDGWEGTVTVPGLKKTKLARRDGETLFATRSALNTVARSLGKRIGCCIDFDEPAAKAATKKAAKPTRTKSTNRRTVVSK